MIAFKDVNQAFRAMHKEVTLYGEHVSPEDDRTGTGYKSAFGYAYRLDVSHQFPLLALKKTHWRSIVTELLWMLRGETTTNFLHKHGVKIWDEWADENGDLGPVYGAQWRLFHDPTNPPAPYMVDQIEDLVHGLIHNPHSRRHIVSAWNPLALDAMALPPCHAFFQCYVNPTTGRLDLMLTQRSADLFLGVPFNIASYSLLMHILGRMIGREPGYFIHSIGDLHVYNNHLDMTDAVVDRFMRDKDNMPALKMPDSIGTLSDKSVDDYIKALRVEDFQVIGYDPHGRVTAPVAV